MTDNKEKPEEKMTPYEIVTYRFNMLVSAAKAEQLVLTKKEGEEDFTICLTVDDEEETVGFIPLATVPSTEIFYEGNHGSSKHH